jgi:hypothetical protein
MALDALRYAFKEIERQAFLLQTKIARTLPPVGFRTGLEPQDTLSAKYLAYQSLSEAFPGEEVLVSRRLYVAEPAFLGNTPEDNLELEQILLGSETVEPELKEIFLEYRRPDLAVGSKVWVEIEDLRELGHGDQDLFASLQRKLISKSLWIKEYGELWLLLPNPIVAFFPNLVSETQERLQAYFRELGGTKLRVFCSDYSAGSLFEVN